MKKTVFTVMAILAVGFAGTSYAIKDWSHQKEPVAFYTGHSHDEDGNTHGAPQHSGGTNAMGCHNASVPYHCH